MREELKEVRHYCVYSPKHGFYAANQPTPDYHFASLAVLAQTWWRRKTAEEFLNMHINKIPDGKIVEVQTVLFYDLDE